MTSSRLRSLAAAAGAIVLAGTLTGCDQFMAEPFAITRVGDAIVMRTCLAMTIETITLEEETLTTHTVSPDRTAVGREVELVWMDNDAVDVRPGDELRVGDGRPRMTLDDWSEPPEEPIALDGEAYVLTAHVRAADGHGEWNATVWFEPSQIVEGEWTDSWGEPMSPPCVHEKCMPGAACFNDWPIPSGDATAPEPTWTPTPVPTTPSP